MLSKYILKTIEKHGCILHMISKYMYAYLKAFQELVDIARKKKYQIYVVTSLNSTNYMKPYTFL